MPCLSHFSHSSWPFLRHVLPFGPPNGTAGEIPTHFEAGWDPPTRQRRNYQQHVFVQKATFEFSLCDTALGPELCQTKASKLAAWAASRAGRQANRRWHNGLLGSGPFCPSGPRLQHGPLTGAMQEESQMQEHTSKLEAGSSGMQAT